MDGGVEEVINFTEVKVEVVKSSTAEGGEATDKPPVTQAYLFSDSEIAKVSQQLVKR